MKRWFAALLLIASPAFAVDSHHPQPVRVADLVGRQLIGPREAQPLLGHVEAVDRLGPDRIAIRIRIWSWFPWGGRTVAVPLESVSFLGPQLALTGLTEEQLDGLPAAPPATPVSAAETIRVGLVKPFH